MDNPYCSCELTDPRVESWLTAAVPVDNPYCSCKLTPSFTPCFQLQSLWIIPAAAVSEWKSLSPVELLPWQDRFARPSVRQRLIA